MLDVHAPHEKIHGFRDFLLHLLTITVGLLIALSLEGCVEWRHHRHLVHEAEAGLHDEIIQNSKVIGVLQQEIKNEQKVLDADLEVLNKERMNPAAPHEEISLNFSLKGFQDVTWKTAQTTGAVAYMSYDDARTFSDIYAAQGQLYKVQEQVVDDVINAAALVAPHPNSWQPTTAQIDTIMERIGLIRMRLLLLEGFVQSLDTAYKKYESAHT